MSRNLKSVVDRNGSAIVEIIYTLYSENANLSCNYNVFSVSACYFKASYCNYERYFCHNGNNQYKQLSSAMMEYDSSRVEKNENFMESIIEDMAPGPIVFSSCKLLNRQVSMTGFEILKFTKLINSSLFDNLISQL